MIGIGAVDMLRKKIRKKTLVSKGYQPGGSRNTRRGRFILLLRRHHKYISWSSRVKGGKRTEFGRLCSNKGNERTLGTFPFVHRVRASNLQSLAYLLDLALGVDHAAEDEEVGEC